MSSNISSGDFGCCGLWNYSCAIGKGCQYGKFIEDPLEKQGSLLYAMQHCNVFKKMFIDHDETFIKAWTGQVNEDGTLKRIPIVHHMSDKPDKVEKSQVDEIVGKLTGKYADDEIANLLKLLGL